MPDGWAFLDNNIEFIYDGDETEEVHHIEEQHLAGDKGMIDHFHKNNLFNLVQLCHKCHHEVHHGSLIIKGYIDTSEGRTLD